jgi:hypothetical protein
MFESVLAEFQAHAAAGQIKLRRLLRATELARRELEASASPEELRLLNPEPEHVSLFAAVLEELDRFFCKVNRGDETSPDYHRQPWRHPLSGAVKLSVEWQPRFGFKIGHAASWQRSKPSSASPALWLLLRVAAKVGALAAVDPSEPLRFA